MRIGGEAPKGRPILQNGTKAMGGYGTLPPRIVIGSLSPKRKRAE